MVGFGLLEGLGSGLRLQLLQEALAARSRANRYQTRKGKKGKPAEVVKPIEKIHAFWMSPEVGMPKAVWPKAEDFMDKWIVGLSEFVAPVSVDTQKAVQQEMWNNQRVWNIAAKWVAGVTAAAATRAQPEEE